MSPLFKKKVTPDKLYENAMKMKVEDAHKITVLSIVLKNCTGEYRQLGKKVIDDIIKLSNDAVKDLNSTLLTVHDNELSEEIVDRIVGYGIEKKEVHNTLWSIGDGSSNKAAKKRARQYYDRYYNEVTGGNPLKKPDLLIPSW